MNNITVTGKQINYLEDVVYNGLNPVGIAGGGGGGDPSDLYYSKTQLDAGQLDNRYYTETELNNGQLNNLYYTETELNAGQLNNLYYTETELDGGQLDNRYYTETEVNTWRNSVTQQEMGWLHGITSDVQTQIIARAVILGTPANDELATWTNASTIKGEANLTFDGTILGIVGNISLGKTDKLIFQEQNVNSSEIGGILFRTDNIPAGDAEITGYRETLSHNTGLLFKTSDVSDAMYIKSNGNVGIKTTTPGTDLEVHEIIRSKSNLGTNNAKHGEFQFISDVDGRPSKVTGWREGSSQAMGLRFLTWSGAEVNAMSITSAGNVKHPSFASGFQGDKWQITEDGDAEFENMFIRGGLTVWELIINRLHYQCGGLIIGAGGGKISFVNGPAGGETINCEDPEGTVSLPFTVGAIVIVQDVDVNRIDVVKRIVREVTAIDAENIELGFTAGGPADTGALAVGDEIVAIGHTSNANLDASIYMSSVDSDNPFMRVECKSIDSIFTVTHVGFGFFGFMFA